MKQYVRTLAAALSVLAMGGTADAAAIRSGPTLPAIAALTRGTAVAYDSINKVYLVVGSHGVVWGRFVQPDGTPVGAQFQIQANAAIFAHFPRVTFSADADGGAGGFLVTWHEGAPSVHGRMVSLGKNGAYGNDVQLTADVSWWEAGAAVTYSTTSKEFLVAWRRLAGKGINNDIRAIRLDNNVVGLGPVFDITNDVHYNGDPSVAYNPTTNEFMVVYTGYTDAGGFGYVDSVRIKAGTNQLAGAVTRLATAGGTYITDVAYNPKTNKFLAAWHVPAVSLARRINADGTLDGDIITLSTRWKAYDALSVAYNRWSDTFFLVSHGSTCEDGGVELASDGIPVDNGFVVTGTGCVTGGNFYPRVGASYDGPNWLVSTANNFTSALVQLIAGSAAPGAPTDPTPGNPTTPPAPTGPTMAADQSSLAFGMIAGAPQSRTSAQTVRITQTGAGTVTWTASTSAAWLQVSPASGTGPGALTVSLVATALPAASSSATVTITTTGSANTIAPITATLTIVTAAASRAPFGSVDSPTNNLTGVTGSIAMTGWAIDDVDVARVRILRDPVAGEPAGLVYLGDATFVEGARPDVASVYPLNPQNARAGWGYLLLTNMLPGLGNGTFRFSAYADDVDGRTTLLGTRTITCANAAMTQPFGALDTPAPGETVAGSLYASFGWVLALGRRADPPGGGTVSVVIDGTVVGSPSGWTSRSDLSSLFPAADYPGITSALAVFNVDTTTLANGMHTMAWVVTDNQGNASGVGSRYFRVLNGGSQVASMAAVSTAAQMSAASLDASAIEVRRGYALETPFSRHEADANGRVTLQSEELDRIELVTHGATEGYLVTADGLRPLPIGSRLDPDTGIFVWQPGVAFIGSYDLVFLRRSGSGLVRQDVRIALNPKGSNRVGAQIVVDLVGPVVAGWAADLDSPIDRGIDVIHVWAYPAGGGSPQFVGEASYGGERPDVAAVYGERFRATGYGLRLQGLDPGTYDLAIFAWGSTKGAWLPARVVRLVVP